MNAENLGFAQLQALKKKVDEANEQRYLEQCRQRLSKIISTKIKTSFIGALDVIEKTFGFLWAENEDGTRSDEATKFYDLYQQMRTDILNNGNSQIRGAQNEIANHVISWSRYSITMPFKPLDNQ